MDKKRHLFTVIVVVLFIVLVQCVIGVAAYHLLPDWATRGQFGDVFGAANTLFSGLAFAGLIYAILLQREDLALQRTELELTRQELQRTAKAQEQSEVALRAQADASSQSARLTAINFLLKHYQGELHEIRRTGLPGGDPRIERFNEVTQRQAVLVEMLDSMFSEIANQRVGDSTVQNK